MDVVAEFVDEDVLDRALIDEATAALPPLPHPDRASLVLTGDVVRSINKRGNHDTEHVPYTQERLTGMVGAKTLHHDETSEVIVVAGPFIRGNEDAYRGLDMSRVVRHEGWHVALFQRDEDMAPLWKRLPAELPGSDRHLFGIAAVGLTEARIERALRDEGREATSRAPDTEGILTDLRTAFRETVMMRHPDEDIRRTFEQAYSAFNQLVTHFCYVLAEDVDARDPGLAAVPSALWERFVDDFWSRLGEVFERIPTAAKEIRAGELMDLYLGSVSLFREWFAHIGFLLEEREGGMYLDVLRHDF
jgi:hypothetical protein